MTHHLLAQGTLFAPGGDGGGVRMVVVGGGFVT